MDKLVLLCGVFILRMAEKLKVISISLNGTFCQIPKEIKLSFEVIIDDDFEKVKCGKIRNWRTWSDRPPKKPKSSLLKTALDGYA